MIRRLPPALARHNSTERGTAMVEAAIILPVLMMIVLGIIEFGLQFKDANSVTSATRVGARTASAEPRVSTFAQDAADATEPSLTALPRTSPQELWVYRAGPNGLPCTTATGTCTESNFSGSCTACVAYTWNSGTGQWTQASSSWTWSDQNACAGDPGMDAVGVYLKALHNTVSGLFGSTITLTAHTVMKLEPYAVGGGSACR